ncbi:MAG: ABC transporter ATP-binding protein [Deltaproteobacteria bacterium]|nr:ABC transporter ATP-binding protein [Deltaproteobacteria bacterium]
MSLHTDTFDGEHETSEKPLDLKALAFAKDRLWPYVRCHRGLFFVSLGFVLLSTFCALLTPWLLGVLVDQVLVPREAALVAPFAVFLLTVAFLQAFASYQQSVLLMSLGQKILHALRQDLLKQYELYPAAEFNRVPAGRMVTRLVNDTSALQDLFTGGIAVALADAMIILGIIIGMVAMHPTLGLVCVSVFPLMVVSSNYFGKRIHENFRRSRAALSRLNAFLAENIYGMWLIQLFNRERDFKTKFDAVSRRYTGRQLETVRQFAFFQPTITILSSFSMSLLIWYGGYRVIDGTVTLGLLVAFMAYVQALYTPIRDITEKYNLFVAALASCEKIFEFMDRPIESGLDPTARIPRLGAWRGEIDFRGAWFRYADDEPWVLKNLNFKIEAGERVGVVGHTGAGKTTLTQLLLRFHDLTQGDLRIDGRNIGALDKRAVRCAIGYIQQVPFLFSGTVEDNIFLWEPSRREAYERLPAFAREPFEKGRLRLDHEIFERGANLSAGERQIIAFLRALVHDPRILILDEATAHVDVLTEKWIAKVSTGIFANRTVLVIAHRLATLRSVDRIVVLHHGELVESGTHRALLERRGLYHKLYEIQARREELLSDRRITASEADPSFPPR